MAIVLKLEMTWDEKYSDLESEEAKPLVADLKTSVSQLACFVLRASCFVLLASCFVLPEMFIFSYANKVHITACCSGENRCTLSGGRFNLISVNLICLIACYLKCS